MTACTCASHRRTRHHTAARGISSKQSAWRRGRHTRPGRRFKFDFHVDPLSAGRRRWPAHACDGGDAAGPRTFKSARFVRCRAWGASVPRSRCPSPRTQRRRHVVFSCRACRIKTRDRECKARPSAVSCLPFKLAHQVFGAPKTKQGWVHGRCCGRVAACAQCLDCASPSKHVNAMPRGNSTLPPPHPAAA